MRRVLCQGKGRSGRLSHPLRRSSQHPGGENGKEGQGHDALNGEKAAALVARNVFAVPGEKASALIGGHTAIVDLVKPFTLILGEVAAVPLVEPFALILRKVAAVPFVEALALILGEIATVPLVKGTTLIDADRRIGGGRFRNEGEEERGEQGERQDRCVFHDSSR